MNTNSTGLKNTNKQTKKTTTTTPQRFNKIKAFQQNKTHTKGNKTKMKAALNGCRVVAQNFLNNILQEQNVLA